MQKNLYNKRSQTKSCEVSQRGSLVAFSDIPTAQRLFLIVH